MKLVAIDQIPTHYDKVKVATVLVGACGDNVLVLSTEHQGGIIYDIFGTPNTKPSPSEVIMAEQHSLFGTSYPVQDLGTMITYINKPATDGRVRLTAHLFLLKLTTEQKETFNLKPNYLWLDRATMLTTPHLREDDKYIISRVLDGKNLNIIKDVNQPGKWIEAKLLAVAEYSQQST